MLSQESRREAFVCFLTSERRKPKAGCGWGAPDLGAPLQTSCKTGLVLLQSPSTRFTLAPYCVPRSPGSHVPPLLPARPPTSTPDTHVRLHLACPQPPAGETARNVLEGSGVLLAGVLGLGQGGTEFPRQTGSEFAVYSLGLPGEMLCGPSAS